MNICLCLAFVFKPDFLLIVDYWYLLYQNIQMSEVRKSGRKKQNKGKVEASTLVGKTSSYVAGEEDMALKRTLSKRSPRKVLGKMTTKKKVVKEVQRQKSRASVILKRTSVKAAKATTTTKRRNLVLLFTLMVLKKFIQMKSKLGFNVKAFHVERSLLCFQRRKVQPNFSIPLKEYPI
jgi:hypothetical protein